jgi:hypothetical protein
LSSTITDRKIRSRKVRLIIPAGWLKCIMTIFKYNLKIGIIALFILVSSPAFTETGKNRHFNLGGGWAWSGIRDEGLSPLYYSGNHVYAGGGVRSISNTRLLRAEIGVSTGIISPAINPELTDSHMRNFILRTNFSYLRHTGRSYNEGFAFFLGGSIGNELAYYRHSQFINNSITVYSVNTVNIDSQLTYRFAHNRRNYMVTLRTYLPVVSFIVRPDFAYIMPSGFLDHNSGNLGSLLSSIEVSTLNRFHALNSNLSFEYLLSNNNAIRIHYSWQYSDHRNQNRLTTAGHGIMLQTMFNF